MEHRYEAVVLGKRDVGDADRVYTFYTRENGKVRAFARGIRRSHARLASQLENFCFSSITIMRGRGVGNISGAICSRNAFFLSSSFDILRVAFGAASIFDRFVGWEQKDESLFALWQEYIVALEICARSRKDENAMLCFAGFVFCFLEQSGYTMKFDSCTHCARGLASTKLGFSFAEGGAICGLCVPVCSRVYPMSYQTLDTLRLFKSHSLTFLAHQDTVNKVANDLQRIVRESLGSIE